MPDAPLSYHRLEAFTVAKEDGGRCMFVDAGVYTRNRAFRLLGSSKLGKNAPLRPLHRDWPALLARAADAAAAAATAAAAAVAAALAQPATELDYAAAAATAATAEATMEEAAAVAEAQPLPMMQAAAGSTEATATPVPGSSPLAQPHSPVGDPLIARTTPPRAAPQQPLPGTPVRSPFADLCNQPLPDAPCGVAGVDQCKGRDTPPQPAAQFASALPARPDTALSPQGAPPPVQSPAAAMSPALVLGAAPLPRRVPARPVDSFRRSLIVLCPEEEATTQLLRMFDESERFGMPTLRWAFGLFGWFLYLARVHAPVMRWCRSFCPVW